MAHCTLGARCGVLSAALTLSFGPALLGQDELLNGLQARWDFDETSGLNAFDTSGSGNNGALVNFGGDDSQWVDGVFGGALAFQGSAGQTYVEVPDSPSIGADILGEFTVASWFRSNVDLAADGGGNRMLEKGNTYFFLQGVANGGMNFLVKKSGNVTAGIEESIAAGEWRHITGVFDGSEIRVYLDGELKNSVAVEGPIDDGGLPLRIGSDDSGNYFNGDMDQVAIWNRALSEEEIGVLIDEGLPEPEIQAPSVDADPESLTEFEGSTVRLSADVSGTNPLTYLWFKDGEPLRAETSLELVIPNAQPEDEGSYALRVQNAVGEATTAAATVTIVPVEDLNTGRLGFWKLDDSSGEVASDSSDSGADGELIDFDEEEDWVDGTVDGALRFNGIDSHILVEDASAFDDLRDEITVSFWINPNSFGVVEDAGTFTRSASTIFRRGEQFHVRLIDDPGSVRATIAVRAGAGTIGSGVQRSGLEVNATQGVVSLGEWQHFSVVYKGGQVTFYKNGFPVGGAEDGVIGDPDGAALVFGDFESGAALRPLDATLDEVSVWARPLSEEELLDVAGQDIAGAPAIARQPRSQQELEGVAVSFDVIATGQRPVSYQWAKDGAPIEGATGNQLTLSRIGPADAGDYTVTVTNGLGSATSDAATLVVEELGAITSGLAAWYSFDNLENDALLDGSGNAIDGELQNFDDDALVGGIVGSAYRLDGIDDFIIIPHDDKIALGRDATVSLWLRPDSVSNNGDFDRVFRKTTNYDFVLLNGGVARLHGVNKNPYSAPGGTVDNEVWQHFAYVVKSDGSIQWYKNGAPIGAQLSGRLGAISEDPLVIGNFQPNLDLERMYEGAIDDMGIWRRALSSGDIFAIYQNGLAGKPLTEEFEPLNIRSIASDINGVNLTYYTPFPSRIHSLETKATVTDVWTLLEGIEATEVDEGLFALSLPLPDGATAFYRITSQAPPPLFVEDFESGAEGWTHGGDGDEWELGTPVEGPDGAFSGDNVYGTDLDDDFDGLNDAWLRSPTIDLSGISVATLEFVEWHSVDPEIQFHFVAVNILDANNDEIIEQVWIAADETADWTPQSIRLVGATADRSIKVEFRLVTDDFNQLSGFFIDDVSVRQN